MLVKLTPIENGIREYYNRWIEITKKKITFEQFFENFTEVDGIPGIYLNLDICSPKHNLKDWYEEFTQVIGYEDEFKALTNEDILKWKNQYGTADTIDQIKEYYKEEIESDKPWVIFVSTVKHHPENAGQWGGYRPYKSGPYIGIYDEIRDTEYYDDCEFPEDYQGYLIKFHIIPVK